MSAAPSPVVADFCDPSPTAGFFTPPPQVSGTEHPGLAPSICVCDFLVDEGLMPLSHGAVESAPDFLVWWQPCCHHAAESPVRGHPKVKPSNRKGLPPSPWVRCRTAPALSCHGLTVAVSARFPVRGSAKVDCFLFCLCSESGLHCSDPAARFIPHPKSPHGRSPAVAMPPSSPSENFRRSSLRIARVCALHLWLRLVPHHLELPRLDCGGPRQIPRQRINH
jgi:hypothetical protein